MLNDTYPLYLANEPKSPNSDLEVTDKYTIEEGRKAVGRLLVRDNTFTAVVAANDLLALGCMDAMNDLGLLIPGYISVTGYDDIQFLERMSPALTTVQVPKYEMGSMAATTLLDSIAAGKSKPSVSLVQPQLIVRNSTATASR